MKIKKLLKRSKENQKRFPVKVFVDCSGICRYACVIENVFFCAKTGKLVRYGDPCIAHFNKNSGENV